MTMADTRFGYWGEKSFILRDSGREIRSLNRI